MFLSIGSRDRNRLFGILIHFAVGKTNVQLVTELDLGRCPSLPAYCLALILMLPLDIGV